jgi:chemotaxis protein CheD
MMKLITHFLYPSGIYVSREPSNVITILGSCVAVCIFDKVENFGGINHYMLPLWNGQGLASPKFGNIAIHKLIEKMISLGSRKDNLVAKVFGGGNVLEYESHQFMIGERNISIAFDMLKDLNIQIVSQSVGGSLGRKIQFMTSTGEVSQMMIEKNPNLNGNKAKLLAESETIISRQK